jgi:YidC/Oxa1 family membrane protein insertase
MDNRRLLLAAVLSMAVLFGWQLLFPPPEPIPERAAAVAERPEPAPPPREPRASVLSDAPGGSEGAETQGEETQGEEAVAEPATEAAHVERVVLENAENRAELTNRGAELVSFELTSHLATGGGAVDLVRRRDESPFLFAFVDGELEPLPVAQALFEVERTPGRAEATFRYRGALGTASKRFHLRPDGFLEVEAAIEGVDEWSLLVGPGVRNPSAEELANKFNQRGAVYLSAGELEKVDARGTDEITLVPGNGLAWIGLQDTYFLVTVLPERGVEQALISPTRLVRAEGEPVEELRLALLAADERMTLSAYLGPKQYDRLHALGHGLDRTIDFGMFGILSRPLLLALRWIHDHLVANYGWAIILLTIAIRVLLFPLNHKSIVSMRRMQTVQPKVQAIQRKWRPKLKDKQGRPNREAQMKMNQEVMEIYKSEGVNPAAGCLPMLLQMPVLFAFYRLLYSAIELRNAPWVGWIQDLSVKDPFYVLPLVMGASMLFQQKLTPSSADPMQRRLFMFMPIIFTIFFLGFPAGLVLYGLTNNVLAIVQQLAYNKFRESASAQS